MNRERECEMWECEMPARRGSGAHFLLHLTVEIPGRYAGATRPGADSSVLP